MKINKTKYSIHFILMIIFFLSSLNVSAKRELNYIELTPAIKSASSLNICIATLDQREVVLMGNQNARFVGYTRSTVGIAYPIKNQSDENFSEVMSTTIANALKRNGSNAYILKTNHSSSKENVLNELKSQEADIFIFITMTKWRTDTRPYSAMKVATELIYNLKVDIYNKVGELIASNTLDTIESGLSPSGSMSMKKIQAKIVDPKYPEVMTALFANSEIEKALQ